MNVTLALLWTMAAITYKSTPATDLQYLFELARDQPWLGSDVATSVSLPNSDFVWIFGDTLTGVLTKDNTRNFTAMPRNSIAVATSSNPVSIKFFTNRDKANPNSGFFTPKSQSDWLWPTCGISYKGKLYLFSYLTFANGTGSFGFAFRGTAVITVDNPSQNPTDWTYTYQMIPGTDNDLNFASATLVEGSLVYIYGVNKAGTVVSRIALEDLSQGNFQKLERWATGSSGSTWTVDPHLPLIPLFSSTTETTVQYFPLVNKYFTIQIPFFGDKILISWADKAEGPWSSWEVIYEIPFPWNDAQHGVFCYAAKSHPELAKAPNEIILTYANNDQNFFDLVKRVDIYVPQVVRVLVNLNQ